jgi:hypothetical protein
MRKAIETLFQQIEHLTVLQVAIIMLVSVGLCVILTKIFPDEPKNYVDRLNHTDDE